MLTPFHEGIPNWIVKDLHGSHCSKCDHMITKDDISAIGVRKSDNQATPFIEYTCPNCDNRVSRAFNKEKMGTVEELCYTLLDEIRHKKTSRATNTRNKVNNNQGPITDKEVASFKKKLKNSKNHNDFMKSMGAWTYHKMLEQRKKNEES